MRATSAFIAMVSLLSPVGLAGCGGGTSAGSAGETVVVQGYGGEYKDIFNKTIAEPFTRMTGIKVKYVAGSSATENYAAVRAAAGNTAFDVAILTYLELRQGAKDKLLSEVTPARVPNVKNLYPAVAKATYGVGIVQDLQQVVLMYDKNRFSQAPDSWTAMWDPRYRQGTIVWNPTNSLGVFQLLTASKLAGGSETNTDPGWRKLGELTGYVVGTPTASSEAVPYMEKGTASAFPYFDGRAAIYSRTTHYDYVVPKEGTYGLLGGAAVPVGAPHKEAGFALLNFWLDTTVQGQWAQAYQVGPSVPGTNLPAGFASRHIVGEQQLALMSIADPDTVSEHRSEWLKRWQQLFS